jgi:tRNA(fMet)-specific endonuclease VapC
VYLLDTNVCIAFLRKGHPLVVGRLQSTPLAEVFLCSVVKAELELGAIKGRYGAQSIELLPDFCSSFPSHAFDDSCVKPYALIRSALERQGLPIGANDLLIASIALANDLTLVTANVEEFGRVPGLQLENWEEG